MLLQIRFWRILVEVSQRHSKLFVKNSSSILFSVPGNFGFLWFLFTFTQWRLTEARFCRNSTSRDNCDKERRRKRWLWALWRDESHAWTDFKCKQFFAGKLEVAEMKSVLNNRFQQNFIHFDILAHPTRNYLVYAKHTTYHVQYILNPRTSATSLSPEFFEPTFLPQSSALPPLLSSAGFTLV